MRPAAGIVAAGHALNGARVRPVSSGRCAVLLEAHGRYRALERVIVPPGMLSDDGAPDAAGTVYTLARAQGSGILVRLRAAIIGSSTCISAWVPYGGASVRGMLRLNAYQLGDTVGYLDPVDIGLQLETHHPATGEEYIIRPADLERAAVLAQADAQYRGARSVIAAPYHRLDGARCRITGAEQPIPWPCDASAPQRCLKTGAECTCTATGREVQIIDDVPPEGVPWLEIGNADILRIGETIFAGPEQLALDLPVIRSVCLRCPRLAPIGTAGATAYCPAHRPTV